MREIKFRAWDKNYRNTKDEIVGHMFYSDSYSLGLGAFFTLTKENKRELMQFTGVKDKNDKEIYEGDVVTKDGKVNAIVFYNAPTFSVKLKIKKTENQIEGYGYIGKEVENEYVGELDGKVKIIGNVFENPELKQ